MSLGPRRAADVGTVGAIDAIGGVADVFANTGIVGSADDTGIAGTDDTVDVGVAAVTAKALEVGTIVTVLPAGDDGTDAQDVLATLFRYDVLLAACYCGRIQPAVALAATEDAVAVLWTVQPATPGTFKLEARVNATFPTCGAAAEWLVRRTLARVNAAGMLALRIGGAVLDN